MRIPRIKTLFNCLTVAIAVSLSSVAHSQQAAAQTPIVTETAASPSPYQEPLFYLMCLVAFVLLVFIMQLSKVLSTVGQNYSRKNSAGNSTKIILLLIGLGATPIVSNAQTAALDFMHEGFGHPAYNALAIIIAIEIFVALYYARMIQLFLSKQKEPAPLVERKSKPFWDMFNKSVAVEMEAAVMTDHDYDGIRELDNALPPWWKYGFYLTIVFAIVYLGYYHVLGSGPLMIEELRIEEEKAQMELTALRAKRGNLVDETTVQYLDSPADLAVGKTLFLDKTCAACHGTSGQGSTGPNFTDDYWIHGGSMQDIFKSIKYGWPDKGMRAWQNEISPKEMAQISSYIKSIHGSNPPNPKEPQGDLWSDVPADSLNTNPADTLKLTPVKIDSTTVATISN